MKQTSHFIKTIVSALAILLFTAVSQAAKVKVIPNNSAALDARIDLIKLAKEEILVEYFEIADDDVSKTGLALLQEAAEKRDVKVKILLDNMHSEITPAQFAAIMRNLSPLTGSKNIEIRVFNPLNIAKPIDQTYRNHDKLFVVDGKYAIIGGRNVSGAYFGLAPKGKANLRDIDILIAGDEVKQAQDYFHTLWSKNKHVKEKELYEYSVANLNSICGLKQPESVDECERMKAHATSQVQFAQKQLKDLLYILNVDLNLDAARSEKVDSGKLMDSLLADMHEVDLEFMFNDPKKVMKKVGDRLASQLYRDLKNLNPQEVTIVTPYLFPTDETLDLFSNMITNNRAKIEILTNSLHSTDSALVHAAYLSVKPRMAGMGINLFEYAGSDDRESNELPEVLHAKVMVVNGSSAQPVLYIGSFNMDHRSVYINREIGVKISGRQVKAIQEDLNKQIDAIRSDSVQVSSSGQIDRAAVKKLMDRVEPEKTERMEGMKIWVPLLKKHI
jgi:putative cardiolipin synthase